MVFPKNPERESILLSHWKQGTNNRYTAQKTGIPEGTVSRYFAKFNKHPERYSRESNNVEGAGTSLEEEFLSQAERLLDIERVKERHMKLMVANKFLEAKQAIEADRALESYISSRGKISEDVYFHRDPENNIKLLPQIVRNRMEEFKRSGRLTIGDLDGIQSIVKESSQPVLIKDIILKDIARFRTTLRNKPDYSLQ